ncbi:MAG: glycosyltransferase [Oscillospiraceae bacterium]|nr:glycosyltransferase [Oscillospiraceae bacterium]
MDKIKILNVAMFPFLNGGVESYLMNVCENINKEKFQFDILAGGIIDYKNKEKIKRFGCESIALNCKDRDFFGAYKKFKDYIKSHRYDVVVFHGCSLMNIIISFLACIPKDKKNKIILHSHMAKKVTGFKKILRFFLRIIMKKMVDYYFACSKAAAETFFTKKELIKTIVIKNAISLNKFSFNQNSRREIRESLNITDEFLMGHIGRFAPQKNHVFLLDVFLEVHKKDKNAKLLLIGQGDLSDSIKNKVKLLNLENNVIFIKSTTEPWKYYQAMDVFVLPSLFEGLGIVLIESQAAGLPTICSDVVPKETNVTENIQYISLEQSPKVWADKILEVKRDCDRTKAVQNVKNAGYEIVDAVRELENFYKSIELSY